MIQISTYMIHPNLCNMLLITLTIISKLLMGVEPFIGYYSSSEKVIPRLKISSTELNEIGKINVHFYSQTRLSEMRHGALAELPSAVNGTNSIGILWKTHGC